MAQTYRLMGAAAHVAVFRAIAQGRLSPATDHVCVDCGAPATEYEHRDYNKQLDVEPVCRQCNVLRGPAIPVGANYTQGKAVGFVVTKESVRVAGFQYVDFRDEAA